MTKKGWLSAAVIAVICLVPRSLRLTRPSAVWKTGELVKELLGVLAVLGHSVPAKPRATQTPSKSKLFTAARCTPETW